MTPPASQARAGRRTVAVFVACTSLAACADDRFGPCEPRVCDPRDSHCVDHAAELVACLRDRDPVVPSIRFVTADALAQESATSTPEELAYWRNYWAGESLVGLMPADYDPADEAADSLAGFVARYRSRDKEIIIITDRQTASLEGRYSVLVHEMVHASQDHEYDLRAHWDAHVSSFDESLAWRATIEGEAELYQNFVAGEVAGFAPEDVAWNRYYLERQVESRRRALESETPSLDAGRSFPYAFGGEMMYWAWDASGHEGVIRTVLDPPHSTRSVLLGLATGTWDPPDRDSELAPRAVPIIPGHTYLGGSAQGSWLINAMLERLAPSQRWSPALTTIAADELAIFLNEETGERVAVWRLLEEKRWLLAGISGPRSRWSTEPDVVGTHGAFQLGGDVVLVATEGSEARALFERFTGWESVDAALERSDVAPAPRRLPAMMR